MQRFCRNGRGCRVQSVATLEGSWSRFGTGGFVTNVGHLRAPCPDLCGGRGPCDDGVQDRVFHVLYVSAVGHASVHLARRGREVGRDVSG